MGEDGKLKRNPAEQEVLVQIRKWAKRSDMTLRWMAARLNKLGHPSKSGKPWVHTAVKSVLATSARYEHYFAREEFHAKQVERAVAAGRTPPVAWWRVERSTSGYDYDDLDDFET